MYQPEIETLAIDKMRQLQSERLAEQVAYLYKRVPFYKNKLDEAGVGPADIRSIHDIHKLPFTKKGDLRDNYPFGLFAVPQNEISRIHGSSGTTGKPTVVGYTKGDIDIFSEVIARSLVAAGCRPGMIMQNAYGYGLFTGGLGLHYGAERLGMAVVPVSGGMTERQIMLMQDFGSDALCCTPSYAMTIAEELRRRDIDPQSLKLKFAILGAEPWTESVRADVERGLGVTATNIYGLSEVMGPGVSQEDHEEKGTGSYIWEDHFYPEIVDRVTGEPLPYGENGVLVFTTLTKKAMPVLRYWTNDITSLYYDKAGKRTHVKMGQILGRSDDMLIIRGVNLFHTQVEAVLEGFTDLSNNYQLLVKNEGTMDEVEVMVELDIELSKLLELVALDNEIVKNHDRLGAMHRSIQKKINDNIGLTMKVHFLMPGAIPRSEGGKLNRIVDTRKK
ncbi:phenylacetate--CoA ligase [Flavipsychrobacter stenotrophus]|uniref:Phenylacetate-coenzyme A ligase n=1 Tax=Flavipsychrobacter stenotrophus TaxID=2077091 RepID=A0A2S7SQL2_9BACT|nr:AMP-binding protein [Flavipsychrobacter stenotrophus]PQJ08846.1 phenylacetate--CoA ligase [Flavipsychrobacter stenotrophus]